MTHALSQLLRRVTSRTGEGLQGSGQSAAPATVSSLWWERGGREDRTWRVTQQPQGPSLDQAPPGNSLPVSPSLSQGKKSIKPHNDPSVCLFLLYPFLKGPGGGCQGSIPETLDSGSGAKYTSGGRQL